MLSEIWFGRITSTKRSLPWNGSCYMGNHIPPDSFLDSSHSTANPIGSMRFPFEALGESWEAQLRAETVVPPIRTVQDFLQRDQYVLLRQLKCTFEDLLALKRQVLTLQFPVVEQNQSESGLLSVFSKVLTSNHNNEVHSSTITSSNTHSILSGLAGLDNLFACNVTPGGGIPRSQVCCLAGESGSGRSQIAMHTAINAAMQGHCVLYIDTHNAVSARRLHSFLSFQLVEEQITMSTTLTQVVRV